MALTFTRDDYQLDGTKRKVRGTVTFDSSYATAGETFAPTDVGLTAITDVRIAVDGTTTTTALVPTWNRSVSAPTLKVFTGNGVAALAEVSAATNLSALVCRYEVVGY